jgi:hypothetical protein
VKTPRRVAVDAAPSPDCTVRVTATELGSAEIVEEMGDERESVVAVSTKA